VLECRRRSDARSDERRVGASIARKKKLVHCPEKSRRWNFYRGSELRILLRNGPQNMLRKVSLVRDISYYMPRDIPGCSPMLLLDASGLGRLRRPALPESYGGRHRPPTRRFPAFFLLT
jgi:hypothetical protein